jgi:hypothetical protein
MSNSAHTDTTLATSSPSPAAAASSPTPADRRRQTATRLAPSNIILPCVNKASSQALIYNQSLVCEDAVNAEVLLRLARNELLERAQQTDRRVTALVDEEYVLLFVPSLNLRKKKENRHER